MKIVRVKNVTKSNIKVEYFVNNTTVTLFPDEVLDVGVFDVTKEKIYRSMIKRGLQVKFVKVPDNYIFILKDNNIENNDIVCLPTPVTTISTDVCDEITVTETISTEIYDVTPVTESVVDITEIACDINTNDVTDNQIIVKDTIIVDEIVETEQDTTETIKVTDDIQEQINVQIEEKPKRGRKKKVEVDTEVEANN